MTFPVPATQVYVDLDRFGTGQLVTAQALSIDASNVAHALAAVPRSFAALCPGVARSVAAQTFVVPFRRVPYADTVAVIVSMQTPDPGGALVIPTATIDVGVGAPPASGPFIGSTGGLDGGTVISGPTQTWTTPSLRACVLDVTGVTTGNVDVVAVQCAEATAASFDGLALVQVLQPPRAASQVTEDAAAEPGINPASLLAGQPIIDGSAFSSDGFVRMASQTQAAEQCGPQFVLVDYDENATPLWKTTLAAYATLAASDAYVLPLRVMYETVPTTVKVTAWARVTAASGGDVRITVGTTQIVLNAAAVGGVQTLSLEADVDVSAYDEWAQVTLEAKSAVAGQPITVHGWAAIDTDG